MENNSYPLRLDYALKLASSFNYTDPRNEGLAKAEVALLGAIFVITTGSNVIILFAIYRRRKKMTQMHLFIVHLGFTDFQILPQMIWDITFRFIGSDILCRAVKGPIFICSMKEIRQGAGVIDCWADFRYPWGAKAYITWITVSIIFVPVGMLLLCYSLICCEICKNLNGKMQTSGVGQMESNGQVVPSRVSSIRTISRAKIRTVKMTFVIVLSYILCWTPFFSVQMWSVWDVNAPDEDSTDFAFTITMLLASLSSCSNP
ncbi:hypothetical protein XELAEV_18012211mg [Xenopus laevis]|uniref:G-protein coupled receptors family 1 profile domain-containing protein n=1 Tax=Xenopus laevis TaxID=8355 RepID=A0A974DM61_XENLA|nr:hypothetical protein XELAEV_18012211mg [Xenopus laevis]